MSTPPAPPPAPALELPDPPPPVRRTDRFALAPEDAACARDGTRALAPEDAACARDGTRALLDRGAASPLRVPGALPEPVEAWADDLFEALASVRRALEPRGVLLLCQGARRDVFPSPMARQMGGQLAYVLAPGRSARREDLVDILAPLSPAERVRAATVDEQAEQAQRWAATIAALPD